MTSLILQKASAWRAKYIGKAASSSSSSSAPRTAVVVGATSGIGEAISHRFAEQGWKVVAVGRHREGRAEAIVATLDRFGPPKDDKPTTEEGSASLHSFVACDCFSLKNVKKASEEILSRHETIDALVMTQGMATTQGFTRTEEGNDQKLTLHYFSRMAFARLLLPGLGKSSMPRGAVVLSVLSGGVHGPFGRFLEDDFSLKNHYSVKNAADAAGYYTDLGFDRLAKTNPKINFVHAAPGFVNTNWGTEFNPVLRGLVRIMQPLGKKASDCAEFMVGPTVFASAYDDDLPPRSSPNGVIVMGEKGQSANLTNQHTEEAVESVWEKTSSVLNSAFRD